MMGEISLDEYCGQIENEIERGHYMEAVAHGKHILKQYPKHLATHQLLGKAMLEAGQDEYAADMFRRVLSADPEDLIAWVGTGEVHNNRGELDAAVWYLERAFEIASDSKTLEEELRQLYSRRDGVELSRTPLTPGALARLYLKGDLLSRAISELRALLAEHPERVELSVALAEALWRNGQRLEASEVCQRILDKLPDCLKANLILGTIWTSSGREEGQIYLQRAEALDPENRMAQELFGTASPLPPRQVQIMPLEYRPPTEEERPKWMAEGVPLTEEEAALVDITAGLEAQIEIPSWLEEIAIEEETEPLAPPGPAEPPEEAIPVPAEGIPAWLTGVGEEELVVGKPEAVAEEETPDWLAGLGLEPIGEEEEETPEWLTELGIETTAEEITPSAPAEQPPDWLAGLREQLAEGAEQVSPLEEIAPTKVPQAIEAPTPVAEEAPLPAWLEGDEMPSGDEALAWLEQLTAGKEEELLAQAEAEAEARTAEIMGRPRPEPPPPVEAAPEPAPRAAEEEPIPAPKVPRWVQELASPALAPSIAGEVAVPEATAAEIEALPEEAMPPPVEEALGWTAFGEPEAVTVEEEVPPPGAVEAPIPAAEKAPLPAWLEGDEMPSGDEALAWLEQLTAGKEEELLAQAEAEAEARTAEIMGRPRPEPPPPVEAAPEPAPRAAEEEPIPAMPAPAPAEVPDWVRELAPPEAAPLVDFDELRRTVETVPGVPEEALVSQAEETFGWTAFGEPKAPPEAPEWARIEKVEAPPAIEMPGVVEMEITIAPPEIPAVEAPAEPFSAERAYLKEHPRDYEAWLTLARALWQAGERKDALEAYSRVIRSGKLLESVIPDLEEYLEQWLDVRTQRTLGDAYMKDGQLQKALDIYRQALESL